MTDNLTPEDRRKTMRAVKGKGTKLERRLWAILTRNGISGWHKNVNSIIGKPDVAFPDKKVVIFVDGCFWHSCPICQRKLPQANHEYWLKKINRNVELAKINENMLLKENWKILRIWEHEMRDAHDILRKITDILCSAPLRLDT